MAVAGEAALATSPHDEPPAPGITEVALGAWPLLLSILLLMTGAGLQGSLLGVRAEQASFSSGVTGLILGLYFVGYVVGSQWAPGLIRSVGHIRVFAALASLASAAIVIHGIWVSPVPWLALRFVTGVCVAGLFVVSESWLNDVATSSTRASLLGIYNAVVSGGLAIGSGLLNVADTAGVVLFVFGSIAVSMAAVPVTLAPYDAPPPRGSVPVSWRTVLSTAPLGVTGVIASGLAVGSALGFGAVYATRAGFGVSGASIFVVTLLVGATVGQVPLGNWSDRTDRRYVLFTAAFLIVIGSILGVAGTFVDDFPLVLVGALLIGAGAFSMYGLSVAHVADYTEPEHMISAASRLLTLNGLGAAAGPFAASIAIGLLGPEGLFYLLAVVETAFCSFVVIRVGKRAASRRHSHFTPIATGATVAGLDPVVSEVVGVEADELRRRRIRSLRIPDVVKKTVSKTVGKPVERARRKRDD